MWKTIANQMRGLLTYNTGLKCLSVISAALLWLLVVNLDDPTQSRNFTATVTLENVDQLTKQGKYYELPEGNTVTFRVTARRSVIEDLSSSDFLATADFLRLEDDERIPIEVTVKRHANALTLSSKTHYLKVLIQDLSETTFMIQAAATGKPADGFEVGSMTVSPDIVSVSGPADIVSTIESAVVQVDVSGQVDDFEKNLVPKYYTKAGQEIETASLEFSTESVKVAVDMCSVQEVKIAVETRGKLSEGMELESITTSPETIRLKGQPDVINSITTITIPGDVIDLSKLDGDLETTVDIMSYLPEGQTLADNVSSQVTVKVSVATKDKKTFKVRTSNLTIRNLSPGLTGVFVSPTVGVEIGGLKSLLKELDAETLTGYVDVSGLTEGMHTVSVVLDLDEELTANKATTDVRISRLSEDGEDEEDTVDDSGDDANTQRDESAGTDHKTGSTDEADAGPDSRGETPSSGAQETAEDAAAETRQQTTEEQPADQTSSEEKTQE